MVPGPAILLCTLGGSWAVVPEVYGFLAPDRLPLYRNHPDAGDLVAERARLGVGEPGEIWVVTTGGETARSSAQLLRTWWRRLGAPGVLRLWFADGTDALSGVVECRRMRELVFRACFCATARVGPDALVLSLAGGRKTMSADLQQAGHTFGCAALLHVVDAQAPLPDALRQAQPELMAAPLSRELAGAIRPVVAGRGQRSVLVDTATPEYPRLVPDDYPLDLGAATSADGALWRPDGRWLTDTVEARQRESARILVRHLQRLLGAEEHLNWIGLYRLPPGRIDALRETLVGDHHRQWFRDLPKADLHLHVGGILDLPAQREVARAVWDNLAGDERQAALDAARPLLTNRGWPADWPRVIRGAPPGGRAARAAAVLLHLDSDELERRLYEPTEPRVALATRHPRGFDAYTDPGELAGSALLGHEAAIAEYARQVYRRLRRDGVRYAEVRGSPDKYLGGNGEEFLARFAAAIRAASSENPGADVRFLVVLDRRIADETRLQRIVRTAVSAHRALDGFVVGLDVAGDEGAADDAGHFERLARVLEDGFVECLPLTIHAGEGTSADRIWSAVYRLHAQRVGHGLTLHEQPSLAERLRDRNVAVELCPTSNIEVVGFVDPADPRTTGFPAYPLATYWRDLKLPLLVCTDNPGISRTDLSSELVRASRLGGGLSLWDALAIVRAGFTHAFAPAACRTDLLRDCDRLVTEAVDRLHGVGRAAA